MYVVHAAFECAPIFKTGGLGDVVGALPKYLGTHGVDTRVIMPGYGWVRPLQYLPRSRVPVWYIPHRLFARQTLWQDKERRAQAFATFAFEVLNLLRRQKKAPDIIHCHDWHTALIPFLLHKQADPFFANTKTVLTIHNMAYTGRFLLEYFSLPQFTNFLQLLDKRQTHLSFLKLGIETATAVTTVSQTHAKELMSAKSQFKLTPMLNARKEKIKGIINGLDYSVWNPRTDRNLTHKFDKVTVSSGKMKNKYQIQKRLGLLIDDRVPMFGFIARFAEQKGVDLLVPLLKEFAEHKWQCVILGTGDASYEAKLKVFQKKEYRDWISITFGFDEKLAHQIYAASDFFLIPSRFEPCGLTQMISMSYGTIPIATKVGGLVDTITHQKTGLLLSAVSTPALKASLLEAHDIYAHRTSHKGFVGRVMRQNFSWEKSAREYVKLYHTVLK